jgi:hypothetical protein
LFSVDTSWSTEMPGSWIHTLRDLGLKCLPGGSSHVCPRYDDNIPVLNSETIKSVSADKGCSSVAVLRVDCVSAVELAQAVNSHKEVVHVVLGLKMSDLKAVSSSPFRAVHDTSRASLQSAEQKEDKKLARAELSLASYIVADPTVSLPTAQYVDALSSSLDGQTPLAEVVSTVTAMLMCGNTKEAVASIPHPGSTLPPRSLESSSDYVSTVASTCWLSALGTEGKDTHVPAILLCHFSRPDASSSKRDDSSLHARTMADLESPPRRSGHSTYDCPKPIPGKEDLLSHVPVVVSVVNFEGQV